MFSEFSQSNAYIDNILCFAFYKIHPGKSFFLHSYHYYRSVSNEMFPIDYFYSLRDDYFFYFPTRVYAIVFFTRAYGITGD